MNTARASIQAVALIAALLVPPFAACEEEETDPDRRSYFEKTMGGRQYWGDVVVFHDWRIQRNVFTGHHRLLDGDGYRHASGSREHCQATLDQIASQRQLPRMAGKVVVLVHGLFRSTTSFDGLAEELERAGYRALPVAYPSTQVDISEAAGYLQSAVESLDGVDEIHFVAHSLGGLVVRACLAEHPNPRVKRVVFIGVPNTGAHLADIGKGNMIWRAIGGPAGQQLVTDRGGLIAKLPAPHCEYAVIAGGRGDESGFHPLVPGDDDGTVAVSSTQLPGSADFSVVPCLHTLLPSHEVVRRQTLSFLQSGRLRAPEHE